MLTRRLILIVALSCVCRSAYSETTKEPEVLVNRAEIATNAGLEDLPSGPSKQLKEAMDQNDRIMPLVVKDLHKLDFDYQDGEGIDFEPYSDFLTENETREWIQAWTGNKQLDGREYRIFGQDGTGGYAAFWLKRSKAQLLTQPIVFFGSEGEVGVVADNFSDYLWLLAGGVGPKEAVEYPNLKRSPNKSFTEFARKHAEGPQHTPSEVIAKAQSEFPKFVEQVHALSR